MIEELEKKQSSLHGKMIIKTNTVGARLYSYKNVEAVKEQVQ